MGWRFRRGVRVLPGVRLNISKRGISSVSIGRRGLTLHVGRRGTKETIGLPGTGISYTTPVQHLPQAEHPGPVAASNGSRTEPFLPPSADATTVGWGAIIVRLTLASSRLDVRNACTF